MSSEYNKKEDLKNRYSLFEVIGLGISFVLTKVFYPKAKLISYPIYMRGKKSLEYGTNLSIGYGCRFDLINPKKKTLFIGENCEIGDYCHIVAVNEVIIGNNFLCASKVFISDTSHGVYIGEDCSLPSEPPKDRCYVSRSVIIGDNVWIGDNVVILPGVKIGSGCIIGANAVVTKSIEPNTIVAGVPAKPIKKFDEKDLCWVTVD